MMFELTALTASVPNSIEFSIKNMILGHLTKRGWVMKRIPITHTLTHCLFTFADCASTTACNTTTNIATNDTG